MKSKLGKKWLAVGLIWVAIVALSGWNNHLINQVQSRRQEQETLQMDLHFLRSNQSAIQEVRQRKARLTHPVKSFSLGYVVVENDLKRLSWDFELQQLRVEADKNAQGTRSVPIEIFATGAVPAIVGWLAAVEEAYPYLVIDQMDISYDSRKRICRLQATFDYHFSTSGMESTG